MSLQKQYREKEGECMSALREVIKELTGKEPQTRQDVLKKTIDLLESLMEIRRPGLAKAVSSDLARKPYLSGAVTRVTAVPRAEIRDG